MRPMVLMFSLLSLLMLVGAPSPSYAGDWCFFRSNAPKLGLQCPRGTCACGYTCKSCDGYCFGWQMSRGIPGRLVRLN